MAIAYGDITSGVGGAGRTSLSWTSPAVSGSDTIGFVSFYTEASGSTDPITGVTWGGIACTLIRKQLRANNIGYTQLWYIVNPASSATVEITCSTAYLDAAFAQYYTGASQSGVPDSDNSNSTTPTNSITVSTTTVADNCWVVCAGLSDNGGISAGTGMTSRGSYGGFAIAGDSNGAVTPAGSYSMTLNGTGNGNQILVMASFKPAGGAVTPSRLALLGVG